MVQRKAIAIGASAGGIEALDFLLPHLSGNTKVSVFVVQHISAQSDFFFVKMMSGKCKVKVKEASNTEEIAPGVVYFAPPDHHLLIEEDNTLTLTAGEKVNFSRPSIDIMFETAANVYREALTGILLTGANSDGSLGLKVIKQHGGITIVQDPHDAKFPEMPMAALRCFAPDIVGDLKEIAEFLEKA
jgi:two-component system, chemotaxis family, protein-glutamate methylesterase/glutaminase